jgi:hypothetical protein
LPDAVQSPGAAGAGALWAAPDDPQQLEQEIERTREQLGETVEQLPAKADVKSRARAKAAEVSGRVKTKASQAQQQAAAQAGTVRSQLADKATAGRQKTMSTGGAAKGQLQSRAAAVGTPIWEATPEQVRRAVAKGASAARHRRVQLAVAAVALTAGCLVVRWWRKR